jgi:hypothetical protein
MPVHIGEISSEVAVSHGDLPLSEAQVEMLVKVVLNRLEESKRAGLESRAATRLRPDAAPRSAVTD